ncbi:glycosyltransferase family 4 protein [Pannus brasiliensis CCIBt3594]|uniref:Glycosyltransferase family 4 protein n=1 Tax=Pannus brasiliensis CCIBt3594 TaxID=1427578 RepID=A0AAW9QFQ8_9CHRO
MNDLPSAARISCIGIGWFPRSPGGLDRYVYELTHHLAREGDAVELCGVGLPDTPLDTPVKLTDLAAPDRPLWQRYRSARANFRPVSGRVDAINAHFALYSFPLLDEFPREIPVTFTFHGPWALESQREGAGRLEVLVKEWIERAVYRHCDRFLVLSKAFGAILHERYRVPARKIHVIPGGVDTDRFRLDRSREQARQLLNWPLDRYILFTPRRLVRRMGLDTLLNALAGMRARYPDLWLAIAGKGPARADLERQTRELSLENHVRFLGYVPEEQLSIAYQAADLTVLPSQSLEGFGLVLVESLACGTPVLCTPIGGMPEVIAGFSPESITVSASATAIAARLTAFLDGEIALPSRESCREHAVANFSWTNIAPRVRQVLLAPKFS